MQPEFWHQRWQEQQIGFHLPDVNPHLRQRWGMLGLAPSSTVLVPLCGKTRDMRWLRNQGHRVVGVELSAIAADAFFVEDGHQPVVHEDGAFCVMEADGIRILVGDFFQLEPRHLDGAVSSWDRGSLVALPPEMRTRYAAHVRTLMPADSRVLLVTFDYAQHEMAGPPFAVSEAEVRALYAAHAHVDLVDSVDILEQEPRFKDRGLTSLSERVYTLTFRG